MKNVPEFFFGGADPNLQSRFIMGLRHNDGVILYTHVYDNCQTKIKLNAEFDQNFAKKLGWTDKFFLTTPFRLSENAGNNPSYMSILFNKGLTSRVGHSFCIFGLLNNFSITPAFMKS